MIRGDYDDTLKFARYTTKIRPFLVIFFSFLTAVGSESVAVRDLLLAPKGASSPIPGSYMNPRHHVDMEAARKLAGSTLNASGEVRNASYFWKQLLKRNPEMFSKGNKYRIEELGLSPKVDGTWVQHNPTHQSFLKDVLHHHHIDQGRVAVPLPKTIHEQWTSVLHGN